ncbi:SHOOT GRAVITROPISM-like protein [Perilla frutescens var. frutescens]|nr:SHOOT GRAVITROPISM-like protein [Perilla frutescens var. frutescens]
MEERQLLTCTATTRRGASSSAAAVAGDPSLDLQLSISVKAAPSERVVMRKVSKYKEVMKMESSSCVEALKWQAAEQIRLAAMEKAYAERVRELSRREMELAQSEFARARALWERARHDVQRAERMTKERRPTTGSPTCMEITCHSCRHKKFIKELPAA